MFENDFIEILVNMTTSVLLVRLLSINREINRSLADNLNCITNYKIFGGQELEILVDEWIFLAELKKEKEPRNL